MTYRERRERRAARLREWAEKRRGKSAAAFKRAETIASGIPLGQPILVGHHSERHARRDQDRIHNSMRAGVDHAAMAASMESRAANIEAATEHAIYSDDADAIERLEERIGELEGRRERMKAINRAIRKGPGWEARIDPPLSERERGDLASLARAWGGVYKPGYPPYALSNIGGNLSRLRARLERLKADAQARHEDDDPHCTCNDCIDSHARKLDDVYERSLTRED